MSEKQINFINFINLIVINGIALAILNLEYPLVGHDYTYAIPSFLDSALHYRLNGLAVQWFTPTFGGGLPAFSNPNNMQFSIPVFLSIFLPPWSAIMLTVVIYISTGYIACYYLFRRTLNFHWGASILSAVFFSANGFVLTRIATGQVGYFAFSLLPVFMILLFDEKQSVKTASMAFGVLAGMYIHYAGYFVLVIFGLSILIFTPLLYLYKPSLVNFKRLPVVLFFGGLTGIVIAASKLMAVHDFMRFFPRLIEDHYDTSPALGIAGIGLQLLGTPTLAPLFQLAGKLASEYPMFVRAATGTRYGMWELDISLPPIAFIIIVIGLIQIIYRRQSLSLRLQSQYGKAAFIALLFFIYLTVEFILARGFIYPHLRNLPILSSLRGNVRFTGSLLFPLVFLAAAFLHKWLSTQNTKSINQIFALTLTASLFPLISYFNFEEDMFWMFYDINLPQKVYTDMMAGNSFEMTSIGNPKGKNIGALLERTSNLNLYEPVFGFRLEHFAPLITPGSIWVENDGYLNMTDPTGYVYPEINHNNPFERFRVEDRDDLALFAKHIQPKWKIPAYQIFLNWLSGLGFIFASGYVLVSLFRKKHTHRL